MNPTLTSLINNQVGSTRTPTDSMASMYNMPTPTVPKAQSDYLNQYSATLGLAPMKAFNNTIGWDPTKNSLENSYNSPLMGQYQNYINTQLKPDFQMHTYAPTVRSYGINNNAGGGYMLGDNGDAYNNMQTDLSRQYTDKQNTAYDTYNTLADNNYKTGLNDYYINNPNAFTNRDPNADVAAQSAPQTAPTPTVPETQPQVQQPSFNNQKINYGDTLSGIWNSKYRNKMGYNDFINFVKQNNGISNPNLIRAGATLKLPGL